MIESINPFNQETLKSFKETSDLEIVLSQSQKAFQSWRKLEYQKKAALFLNLSKVFQNRKTELAKLISLEMGKLIGEAESEIIKCAANCEFYAETAEKFLSEITVPTEASKSYIHFEPLGTILAIMPWNFPFWQVIRFAAPTLMAGNVCILKHASNVSLCSSAIEKCFKEAGFPDYVFQSVFLKSDKVERLIAHNIVKGVSLTGSTQAGKKVGELCGQHIKKSVLELGGSDPYIVFKDADLNSAVSTCFKARMNNAGQTCIAAKRFIVAEEIYDDFLNSFLEKMKALKIGNPLEYSTTLAPLSRHDLRDELIQQIQIAVKNGATLTLGGNAYPHPGAFVEPTILENISPKNPAFNEEFFGPVALFFKFKSEKEALEIANSTPFGLGAALFSKDKKRMETIATQEIEAGNCFINTMVRSDPRLPFGGIKSSGYGRELSAFGIYEFVNIKTVYIN